MRPEERPVREPVAFEMDHPKGFVLRLGYALSTEEVAAIMELVALFERCRRGNLVDALVALALIRRSAGGHAGHAALTLEMHQGGVDASGVNVRSVDWRESLFIAASRHRPGTAQEQAGQDAAETPADAGI